MSPTAPVVISPRSRDIFLLNRCEDACTEHYPFVISRNKTYKPAESVGQVVAALAV